MTDAPREIQIDRSSVSHAQSRDVAADRPASSDALLIEYHKRAYFFDAS